MVRSKSSRRILLGSALMLATAAAAPMALRSVHRDALAPRPPLTAEDAARLSAKNHGSRASRMSAMGSSGAQLVRNGGIHRPLPRSAPSRLTTAGLDTNAIVLTGTDSRNKQSETSLAINTAGTVLVAAWNDARGFGLDKDTEGISLTGVAVSADGGKTWVSPRNFSGLPVVPSVPGGAVFGDPDVKYDAKNNRWILSSIYIRPSDGLQGLCVHVSSNDGQSWLGPFEIGASFQTGNSADKEFIDVNPVTGRIVVTWTNFPGQEPQDGDGGGDGNPFPLRAAAGSRPSPAAQVGDGTHVSILASFSDDGGQSWAPYKIVSNTALDGQDSVPRCKAGTRNGDSKVYVVWSRFPTETVSGSSVTVGNVGFAISRDGGETFGAPRTIAVNFPRSDEILGNDRVNGGPSFAVDPTSGALYVVYQANDALGEGDIAFIRSLDGGGTFSAPILIDSNPGNDRAQWFPSVTVDPSNGTVHVVFYDQGHDASGDVTEVMVTDSADQGTTWSRPTAMLDRPFHAGFGNDTGQPNLGDYIANVARNGIHHVAAAATGVTVPFDQGEPSTSLDSIDAVYAQRAETTQVASLRLSDVQLLDLCVSGGNAKLDPEEGADLTFSLENFVLNPHSDPVTFTNVQGTLTATIGDPLVREVFVRLGTRAFPDAAPGATVRNVLPFRFTLPPFGPGQPVDLTLSVTSDQGTVELPYRLDTGSDGKITALVSETFDGVAPGVLPAGWTALHGAGATTTPWSTAATLTGSNAAFHAEVGGPNAWERLLSPQFTFSPAVVGHVSNLTVDFDIAYNLEFDPTNAVRAYDGVLLRVTDLTPPDLATPSFPVVTRSVLAEGFADRFTTGSLKHYPKHLPRSDSTDYFADMSVWSGSSNGPQHVSLRFTGGGFAGRTAQLRWEYTEDGNGVCAQPPCGVAIDNVQVRQVEIVARTCVPARADLQISATGPADVKKNATTTYAITVTNRGPSGILSGQVVNDSLQGLAFVAGDAACPSYPCELGVMAPGATRTFRATYVANFGGPSPSELATTYAVAATDGILDPTARNDSVTVKTQLPRQSGGCSATSQPFSFAALIATLLCGLTVRRRGMR